MSKSEFGSGYATCLLMFTFHEARLAGNVELYASLRAKHPEDTYLTDREAISMWADGAVDHLRDLKRPRRGISLRDWNTAKKLRDRMFDAKWGGRFAQDGPPMDYPEAATSIAIARELLTRVGSPATLRQAEAEDRARGLVPDLSGYVCEEPMERRIR